MRLSIPVSPEISSPIDPSVVSGMLGSTLGSGIFVSMVGSIGGTVVATVGSVVGAVVGAVVGLVVGMVVAGVLSFAWQPQAARAKIRISASAAVKSFFMKLASKIKITVIVCPNLWSLIMRKFLFGTFDHFLLFLLY